MGVRRLENALRAIRESKFILPGNKELILGFWEFLEACREDIVRLMLKIENRDVKPETLKFNIT